MYMAPEQAHGHKLDQRADLFSFGSVIYQLLSGRPPFRAPNTMAVLKRVTEDTPRPIQEIIPETPAWMAAIVGKLLAKDPEKRFALAREVGDLLSRCLADIERLGGMDLSEETLAMIPPEEITTNDDEAPKDIPHPAPPKPAARRQLRIWAAAALLVLAIGLGVSEGTGVTDMRGTVIRLFSPSGTLVIEVDDPGLSVTIDGEDMVITGAGPKEIRLKPGQYKVLTSKDGEVVRQQLVTVTSHGRRVVRVSVEPSAFVKPACASASSPAPIGSAFDTEGDADRKAAEYIAAAGGSFQTTLEDRWTQKAPAGKFRLTGVNVYLKGTQSATSWPFSWDRVRN